MVSFIDFPVCNVPMTDRGMAIDYNTRPGQQATNGMRRSLGMSGAQMRLFMTISVRSTEHVRTMRGFFWKMEADSSLVRIRIPDLYGIDGPWSIATKLERQAYPLGVPFATDAMYATGAGHAYPTLETTLSADAALGDREIYVNSGEELPGGCAISIGEGTDSFCYGIAGSWYEGGVNRLKISPVLRKAASAGDVVSLAPIFFGFCVSETPGYDALRNGRFGTHTLEFVEDLTRLVESVD